MICQMLTLEVVCVSFCGESWVVSLGCAEPPLCCCCYSAGRTAAETARLQICSIATNRSQHPPSFTLPFQHFLVGRPDNMDELQCQLTGCFSAVEPASAWCTETLAPGTTHRSPHQRRLWQKDLEKDSKQMPGCPPGGSAQPSSWCWPSHSLAATGEDIGECIYNMSLRMLYLPKNDHL